MKKHSMTVLEDASEIVHYDTAGLPLFIRLGRLSHFPCSRALCHWHEDLEWIRVTSGRMYYYVNGTNILLQCGDCLLVNSRQLHFNYAYHPDEDCTYVCVLARPSLLASNAVLYRKYFQPMVEHPKTPYVHLSCDNFLTARVQELLDMVIKYKNGAASGYELEVLACLNRLWVWFLNSGVLQSQAAPVSEDLSIQQDMTSYIYHHFTEPLTLLDIAAAGKVCRNRCCQLFKKYTRESPIVFLNHYRLRVSRHMLANTDMSITEIALACGFHSSSYYGKQFLRRYQCTPREYRFRASGG